MPRHPHVSPTTSTLSRNVYDALVAKARRRSDVLRLNLGDTWMEPIPCARAENQHVSDHPLLHAYAPTQGEPALLDAIVERLAARGRAIAREDIQVVSGATCGLSVACQALLDPGDEVILPSPYWPLIRGIIASRGAVPVQVPLFTRLSEPGFDLEGVLEANITPRTTAIYLNVPHNPTGRILGDPEMAAIASVAERHDLWVLSDEVYEDFCYAEPTTPAWMREDMRNRTIATHSLSKTYGLAGARVGYTHGPHDAMGAIKAVHAHQVYCTPRPMQVAGARALREGDAWVASTRAQYEEAGRKAAAALDVAPVDGGAFLFVDASAWLGDAEDALPFLEQCLDAGVLLTPGSASGDAFGRWVRLCFTCVSPSDLDEALARLAGVLGKA